MARALVILATALALIPASALGNDWAAVPTPARGKARAIGRYTAGCVRGAVRLPINGPGYRVMRLSRRRTFAHPAMAGFIRRLGLRLQAAGLAPLAVGDLGQPRGGPPFSGHTSHQTGLDADLWFAPAPLRISRRRRETLPAHSVVDAATKRQTRYWSRRVARLLRLAADDRRVHRIFVNPLIKRQLCRSTRGDRSWLRTLRPWWGHASHFHVRLHCPTDSPECVPQPPLPPGDGCEAAEWWAAHKLDAPPPTQQGHDPGRMPRLPARCAEVLAR